MKVNGNRFLSLPLVIGLSSIVACGGGGGSSNQPPTVSSTSPDSIEERTQATLSVSATDSDGSITSYQWEQQSGPNVSVDGATSQLTFIAPEVNADTEISFLVTVTDNLGATASTTVTSTIVDVNRTPSAVDSTVAVEFNSSVEFSLDNTDPDGDEVSIDVIQAPASGTLELLNEATHTYRFTPESDSIVSESLSYQASDGELTSTAIITLDMVDTTAPVLQSVSPVNESERVSVNTSLTLTFDDFVEPSTFENVGPECSGGIQVSHDNFTTCEYVALVTPDEPSRSIEISFAEMLEHEKEYQVKISTGAQNFHGTGAVESIVSSFTTEYSDLRITEVSTSYYADDNRWIEVFNGTSSAIDLANYVIRADSIDLDACCNAAGIADFSLPEKLIQPGQFIVLQGRTGNGYWQSSVEQSDQLVLVGATENNIRPLWYATGFVELLNAAGDKTVDFVRFGDSNQIPVSAEHWVVDETSISSEQVLGKSLVRDLYHNDTNSTADWRLASFITPAGINDIFCDVDADEDGIPDCAEQEGGSFAGLPLYDWGARAGVKDIFIEVDYMESNDEGIRPQREALQKVVDSFAAKGFAVHFDAGDLFHNAEGISHDDFDLGGGNQITYYAQTTFQSLPNSPSILDHKIVNSDLRRKPVFHYMLMANSQNEDGSGGSSGVAEINGNDLIISIGNWGLNRGDEINTNMTINFQASTIMHELGHNLSLRHGGFENTNYKPNYLSVMNYLYQLYGLPSIGNREGDRYYRVFFRDNLNCNLEGNELVNGFMGSPENFAMDYSDGSGSSINENSVAENLGLRRSGSTSVDFDCNGVLDETLVNQDINGNSIDTDTLLDSDDWSQVDLQFSKQWNGSVSGSENDKTPQSNRTSNVMNNDSQPVIEETSPPASLFEAIKSKSVK
ncbi:Ig-like domain-containing protein [Aliikangiella sp. G2MR2-5]|uniref:Ig-like domain-containing protein n=1 Tax=Aliikangiella sp. G2MR2-5 TaxID=2788943 RepID=UPI0018AA7F6C|nr:Ig-like domain-containing protein [Aliikangiella sp. G2MR2-5]